MITNEIMLMISRFLFGDYDPVDFSYDLPGRLVEIGNDFDKENYELSNLLGSELPEICSYYDMGEAGERFTYGLDVFRARVSDVYQRAIPLAAQKKVS